MIRKFLYVNYILDTFTKKKTGCLIRYNFVQ